MLIPQVSKLASSMSEDGNSGSGQEEQMISNSSSNSSCDTLETIPSAALIVHAIILAVFMAVSLTGNSLVLVLVARYNELRTRSVAVSLSMVVADILFTITYTFPVMVTAASSEWLFNDSGCIAFGFLGSYFLITRWFIIGLLCLDRFFTVRFPFSYERHSKCIIITSTAAAWVVPLIASIIPIHTFAEFTLRETTPTCLPNCLGQNRICAFYYGVLVTVTFIIGSVIPILVYSWLYNKGRKIRRSVKLAVGQIVVEVMGGKGLVSKPLAEYDSNLRERQATITFMLLFITVLVTGTPSYLAQLIRAINSEAICRITVYGQSIITYLLLSAPMLTPIVIMRDRTFYSCMLQLLCCRISKKTADIERPQNNIQAPAVQRELFVEEGTITNNSDSSSQQSMQPNENMVKMVQTILSESQDSL